MPDQTTLARLFSRGEVVHNLDGHVFSEIGEFGCALGFMEPFGLDNFTIVNRTLESTLEFLGLGE